MEAKKENWVQGLRKKYGSKLDVYHSFFDAQFKQEDNEPHLLKYSPYLRDLLDYCIKQKTTTAITTATTAGFFSSAREEVHTKEGQAAKCAASPF